MTPDDNRVESEKRKGKKMLDGYQKKFQFDNGYGASVVSSLMSYGGNKGLFEVAVLQGDDIVYDTPITGDVVGYLDFAGVADILDRIKKLPKVES